MPLVQRPPEERLHESVQPPLVVERVRLREEESLRGAAKPPVQQLQLENALRRVQQPGEVLGQRAGDQLEVSTQTVAENGDGGVAEVARVQLRPVVGR